MGPLNKGCERGTWALPDLSGGGERHDRFGVVVREGVVEPRIEGRFARRVGAGMASGRRSADRGRRRGGDRRFCPRAAPHPIHEVARVDQEGVGGRAAAVPEGLTGKCASFRSSTVSLLHLLTQSRDTTSMGDSNPKNTQKKKAQQSAKKVSGQKKPVAPSVPASGKRK